MDLVRRIWSLIYRLSFSDLVSCLWACGFFLRFDMLMIVGFKSKVKEMKKMVKMMVARELGSMCE